MLVRQRCPGGTRVPWSSVRPDLQRRWGVLVRLEGGDYVELVVAGAVVL